MPKERVLTVAEIARRFDVHVTSVQGWIRKEYFPNARRKGPGRTSPWVVPEQDVIDFEKEHLAPLSEKG